MPVIDSRAAEARGWTRGVDSARLAAERAARAAEVSISTLPDLGGMGAAVELWRRVWDRSGEPPVSVDMLRALTHGGNYLAGALREDLLVGAAAGFFANPEAVRLHSHILGVQQAARVRGVGFALKLHQRLWALEHGIDTVTWTFDPLVRANGYFNVSKLGALGTEYHVDFYGSMHDEINRDGASDRVLLTWPLLESRVERACTGSRTQPDAAELLHGGAVVALAVGDGERPDVRAAGADTVLCQVPDDIVGLRRRDPALARAWRLALRETLSPAMDRALAIVGMTRDGWYVLGRPAQSGTDG